MKRMRLGRGRTLGSRDGRYRVQVRRDHPAHLAWVIALLVTMLMVYLATLSSQSSLGTQSVSTSPRVTRELTFEELEMYLVSLYDCGSGESARMLASGYTGRGAAGYVYQTGEGWQVIGAAYEEERDAERIARRLSADEGLDAQVLPISVGKVDMRITAPEIQISAIAEADALLRDQTRQLGNMALQLDRNEISTGTVCTLCAVASTRAKACAEILNNIPGSAENDLCKALIKRLTALSELLGTIGESLGEDTSTLSGMLRCAQTDTFLGQAELQNELLGG